MTNKDEEWRGKIRPQSLVHQVACIVKLCPLTIIRTMALAFSVDLDNIFGIGDGIDGLARTVEEK